MNLIAEKIAALINVKTIVTFAITFVFIVLALRGDVATDMVNYVVIMVLTFYFGTQHERDRKKSERNTIEPTDPEEEKTSE